MSSVQIKTRVDAFAAPASLSDPAISAGAAAAIAAAGGGGGGSASMPSVFIPVLPTTAGIIAAAQAARDAGGGEVEISGIELTLTESLPFYDNVVYVGNNVSFNMFGSTLMSGTILTGDGTFNAFEGNNVDLVSVQTYANFVADFIKNAGVKRVGVKNCLNGIRVGGKYKAGISEIIIEDFHATGCTQWGMWIENAHNGHIARCRLDLNANVAAFVASGGSALNTGNYSVAEVKGNPSTQKGRGIWFHCRGANTSMNDVHAWMCSAAGVASGQSTQTATFTSGQANIAVTDLSKYAVGMGVVFDSTTGNFLGGAQESTTRKTYFVIAMSDVSGAGTIQLSLKIAGTLQTPSASGTSTIRTAGMCLYELSTDNDGSPKFTHGSHKAMDIEQQGTASLYISDTTNVIIEPGILPGLPESIHQIVGRNNDYSLDLKVFQRISSIDFDSERWTFHGVEPAAVVGNLGIGLHYNFSTTRGAISIFGTKGGDIKGNNANTIQFTFPISVSGTAQGNGHTINSNSGQVITYAGTADGGALTMIAMNDERKGVTYTVSNPTQWPVTVNGGGINFVWGGNSVGSFVLPPYSNAQVMGGKNGATYYWARLDTGMPLMAPGTALASGTTTNAYNAASGLNGNGAAMVIHADAISGFGFGGYGTVTFTGGAIPAGGNVSVVDGRGTVTANPVWGVMQTGPNAYLIVGSKL